MILIRGQDAYTLPVAVTSTGAATAEAIQFDVPAASVMGVVIYSSADSGCSWNAFQDV